MAANSNQGSGRSQINFERAAKAVGLTLSAFLRQAGMERATKVLGLRPTLPVHVQTKDQH